MDALAADVSFMPMVSNKKYIVTPKRPLSIKRTLSLFWIFVWGSSFLKIGRRIKDAIKNRRNAMLRGGTPALRTALELTKDIPQKITVAIIARFAKMLGVIFELRFNEISFFPN
jgi:hypothetical protein